MLLLIPQRYEFSSKSQRQTNYIGSFISCCWYHKGTNFQANHNSVKTTLILNIVVADTTKVRIFKQITTSTCGLLRPPMLLLIPQRYEFSSKSQLFVISSLRSMRCCWYHKGTNFQANHNRVWCIGIWTIVVADTTKVRIFKQITTRHLPWTLAIWLLLIPQRYEFSSKSQPRKGYDLIALSCCWYHKGTNFQANHNSGGMRLIQIQLLLIPQRYEFSSKSQQARNPLAIPLRCCWYHKGTNFQANHNM